MLSKCPSCHTDIEHDDFLFEVVCECGVRFNPFMTVTEPPPLDGVSPAGAGPSTIGTNAAFTESNAVFKELRDFGEAVVTGEPPKTPTKAATPPAKMSKAVPKEGTIAVDMSLTGGDCLMTGGEGLTGYLIDTYLPPVSAWTDLDPNGDNPMKAAFDLLWERAQAAGGNGVLCLQWSLSADSTKVMLTGTPVRCTKA